MYTEEMGRSVKRNRPLWWLAIYQRPRLNIPRTNVLMCLNRRSLRLIIEVITGHWSARWKIIIWDNRPPDFSKMSEHEDELETVEHVLWYRLSL